MLLAVFLEFFIVDNYRANLHLFMLCCRTYADFIENCDQCFLKFTPPEPVSDFLSHPRPWRHGHHRTGSSRPRSGHPSRVRHDVRATPGHGRASRPGRHSRARCSRALLRLANREPRRPRGRRSRPGRPGRSTEFSWGMLQVWPGRDVPAVESTLSRAT